jgi:hypothetical protein
MRRRKVTVLGLDDDTTPECLPVEIERGRMAHVWDNVVWFLTASDIQSAEVICALANVWWCIVLLAPGDVFMKNPAFAGLGSIFRSEQWGAISVAVAIPPVVALVTGSGWWRRGALLAYVWYYAAIGAAIAAVDVVNTGVGVYSILAAGAAWGYWRLGARNRG